MARQFAWILAVAAAITPVVSAAGPSGAAASVWQHERSSDQQKDSKQNESRRQRFVKWWIEPEARAELGITDQQSAAIEKIWQEFLPAQRLRYRELEKLEPALAKLIKEGTSDPDLVAREVARVENLTAEVRTSRIAMIYRMQHELTADQRTRLRAMDERRRQADSRKSSDSGRH